MKEWKFLHYSILMHLILFRNVTYIDKKFIDQTEDVNGPLLVQLWTRVWDKNFPFSSSVMFFNYFSHVITGMLDKKLHRAPDILKFILRPLHARDTIKLDHNWGDIFSFPECTIFRVYACPQPPHVLPKYLLPRLTIAKFFW